MDPARGYLHNDCFKVKAVVKVAKVDSLLYNSKEATGCVGLKNQGATCYMNSLLQTLFHLHYFRKVRCPSPFFFLHALFFFSPFMVNHRFTTLSIC